MEDGDVAPTRHTCSRSPFCIHHSAFCIRPKGFTLIELIVVMLILSVLFAMAAPSLSGFGSGRAAAQAASQILTLSRWAREQAITDGRPYRLCFDSANHLYWVTASGGSVYQRLGAASNGGEFQRIGSEFGRDFTIPDGVTLTLDAPQEGGFYYLEFVPSGRSQPARVRVVSKDGQSTYLASLSATEPLRALTPEERQEAGLQ